MLLSPKQTVAVHVTMINAITIDIVFLIKSSFQLEATITSINKTLITIEMGQENKKAALCASDIAQTSQFVRYVRIYSVIFLPIS